MMYKTQRTISIILSLIGSAGVVGTTILAIKATPEATKKLEENKDKNLTRFEKVRLLIPTYLPTLLTGAATISSITASTILSRKAEASLIATSTMLSQGWRKYRNQIRETFGIDTDRLISGKVSADEFKQQNLKPISKNSDKTLYYEEHVGFFMANQIDFLAAVIDLNQRLHAPDPDEHGTFYFTTLKFFLHDAKAKVIDKERLKACENIGWTSDYLYEAYGSNHIWVHPHYTRVFDRKTGELKYVKITFWEDPIELYSKEKNRMHYKSRADYEHEAEVDLQDASALEMYTHGYQDYIDECIDGKQNYDTDLNYAEHVANRSVIEKVDCDRENDDLNRLILSNPNDCTNVSNLYLDEDDLAESVPEINEKE